MVSESREPNRSSKETASLAHSLQRTSLTWSKSSYLPPLPPLDEEEIGVISGIRSGDGSAGEAAGAAPASGALE